MENSFKSAHTYVDAKQQDAVNMLSETLYFKIRKKLKNKSEIIILCIGSDRATGDSLGPLIGHKLDLIEGNFGAFVYGTLDSPVHAKNLESTAKKIYKEHKRPLIIAIDASLGKMEHIGCLAIGEGSLKPGLGVSKNLPAIGDIFIMGIVNFSGIMDILILQNTRLNIVMKMADVVASGIEEAICRLKGEDRLRLALQRDSQAL